MTPKAPKEKKHQSINEPDKPEIKSMICIGPAVSDRAERGSQERKMIKHLIGEEPPLPFPTHKAAMYTGRELEIYDIPEDKKQEVLEAMFIFSPCPHLDDIMYDLHEDAYFTVRDFIVTREDNTNYLCSPFYLKSGGSVLDWIPQNEMTSEQEEKDDEPFQVTAQLIRPEVVKNPDLISKDDSESQNTEL